MGNVPGKTFTRRLGLLEPDLFAAVGRALAGLHALRLPLGARWEPGTELRALGTAAGELALGVPAEGPALDSVVAELRARSGPLRFPPGVPIHGKLFGDQVLLDGDRVGIVDWDDLCLGDPVYDLARLLAHAVYVGLRDGLAADRLEPCVEALLAAYEHRTGAAVHPHRLTWHVAVGLLMRAKISALRQLEGDWRSGIRACLREAEQVLAGNSRFLPRAGFAAGMWT